MRRTKIVCTIGPASEDEQTLQQLLDAGMNVARLNMSHGDYQEHGARIERLRRLREEKNLPVGIMLDTKGPEIRLGKFQGGKVELNAGQSFTLTTRELLGDATRASISYAGLPGDVAPGQHILLDDGLIDLKVARIEGEQIVCQVENGGSIGDRKGVNVPGAQIGLPAITQKDIDDILFGVDQGVDFIAASFVRKASDVLEIRQILEAHRGEHIHIIAKIESQEGVDNLEDILTVSDGIMVARGDLGVEIPIAEVPLVQKRIIAMCNQASKPVITATQMLDSMIRNPRPTRAEANDVANAILDGTDAIMLSGETASGRYPLQALRIMATIAERTEQAQLPTRRTEQDRPMTSVTEAVSHACVAMAEELKASAIITATHMGSTARQISRYRPPCQIVATTDQPHTYYRMSLVWGVRSLMAPSTGNTDEMINTSVGLVERAGFLKSGDVALITAGVPVGTSGTTNLIKVHVAGDVLIRAKGVGSGSAYGKVCVVRQLSDAQEKFEEGDVLVAKQTDNSLMPFIRKASAIITENGDSLSHAAVVGLALDIPVILSAKNACSMLRDGLYVTVHPGSGFVYNGKSKAV